MTNNKERNPVSGAPREVARAGKTGEMTRRGDYDRMGFNSADFFANPFSVMRRMHDEMDRVFGQAFGGRMSPNAFGGGLTAWAPAIEVSERDNEITVCAELPGLKPEEVKVEVTADALVIEGERKQEHEQNQGGRWQSERSYGRFYRTIPLPDGANTEQARADFKNGELKITVPVQQTETKRRKIPIGSGSEQSQSR